MHCWKTINIKVEYGSTRLYLLSTIIFVLVFSFTFIVFGQNHPLFYKDDFFWLFFIILITLYPIHKLVHYYSLFKLRKSVKLRIRVDYKFIPIIRMRIKKMVPKNRYIFTLLAPFLILNTVFILLAIYLPQYAHYACLLLGYHSSMCLVDILYVKNLILAPRNAIIEETPKGYEILIPPS